MYIGAKFPALLGALRYCRSVLSQTQTTPQDDNPDDPDDIDSPDNPYGNNPNNTRKGSETSKVDDEKTQNLIKIQKSYQIILRRYIYIYMYISTQITDNPYNPYNPHIA